MRWGIVTAAVIAVAKSLRLSLMHRGRPMRTRTVFSLVLSVLLFAGGEAFAAERRVALVIAIRATSTRPRSTIRSTTSRQ